MKKFLSLAMSLIIAFVFVFGISGLDAVALNDPTLPYYYGNQLTDKQLDVYSRIKRAVLEEKQSIIVDTRISENDLKMYYALLMWHEKNTFNFDNLSYVYSSAGYAPQTKMMFSYRFDMSTSSSMLEKMNRKADEIIKHFPENATSYQKILYIHDYLVKNTSYDVDFYNSDIAYGALVSGRAKCDGYSKAFTFICNRAGIKAINVVGKSYDNGHMWNMVYYNNKWYNIDVTWDDPDNNMVDNLSHKFFMTTDKVFSGTHSYNIDDANGYIVPQAVNSGMDYYKVYKKTASGTENAEKLIINEISKAAKKGKNGIEIRLTSKSAFDDTVELLFGDDMNELSKLLSNAKKKSGKDISVKYCLSGYYDDNYMISIHFFVRNTNISDYYVDSSKIDEDVANALNSIGIN